MAANPITLKLLIDTSAGRVVCAESGEDFVDVLFSFLTLPLGTIVRLLDKQSYMGSMDKLYACAESIGSECLTNEAVCRAMLLRPRNSSMEECRRLKVNLDDTNTNSKYYMCPSCHQNTTKGLSSSPNWRCSCGKEMGQEATVVGLTVGDPLGIFMKRERYLITDDLVVAPVWDAMSMLSKQLCVKDWSSIEERAVVIGYPEVLQLLNRSLRSKTPLTDVLVRKWQGLIPMENDVKLRFNLGCPQTTEAKGTTDDSKKIKLKLVLKNNRLLYAEAKHDFVELLLSFLTFPIGCAKKLLGDCSFLGCLDNLYTSVEPMRSIHLLHEELKEKLLNPKLPYDISRTRQLINIGFEADQKQWYGCSGSHKINIVCSSPRCKKSSPCYNISTNQKTTCGQCASHDILGQHVSNPPIINVPLTVVDPKTLCSVPQTLCSVWSTRYMITDELVVTPLSIMSVVTLYKGVRGSVEEMEISIGEEEALKLFRALLTSKTAITDAFLGIKRVKPEK